MYWQALGLPGEPSSAIVDGLALWLQWAQTGILAGASENEAAIRYNLTQFWSQKAEYWDTADENERQDLVRLDILAHGLLSALDAGKTYSASPSYWEFWKAYVFGGTPKNPDSAAAAEEGFRAARDAATAARATNQPEMASFFSQTADQIKASAGDAAKLWTQEGIQLMGIPLWAWLVGGGVVLWLIYGPKVSR